MTGRSKSTATLLSILTTSVEGRTYTPVRIFVHREDAESFAQENSARSVFERELTSDDIQNKATILDDRWFFAEVPFTP
jgi:hypothetical protein